MGYINKKSQGFHEESHRNWMNGLSYDIKNPLFKLRLAASSCFFGEPMYYQKDADDKRALRVTYPCMLRDSDLAYLRETLNAIDPEEWRSMTPAQMMEKAIDDSITFDPIGTLEEAVRLRNKEHIRTTPQVIMVRFANHPNIKGKGEKTALLRKYAMDIMKRGDEPAIQLAYQLQTFKKPIPNMLKKMWKLYLEQASKYDLAKYRLESRQYKTVDVVNLVHPKSEIVDSLVKGTLKLGDEIETWESIISEKGSTKEAWIEALGHMGHMALLRNLRNLIQKGVEPATFMQKLYDGVEKGQQLPFRYYSAYLAIKDIASPSILDKLEDCIIKSFEHSPKFGGKIMSLCDNSGSARGASLSTMSNMKVSDIANLCAVFTGYLADDGYIGVFGDRLAVKSIRKKSSVFEQIADADSMGVNVGQATENGIWLFWDNAIRNKEHWDSVFIYSDMQAGHGGLYGTDAYNYAEFQYQHTSHIDVPKLISRYRSLVNPNVKVYCVQVAGYQDTIVPEFYDKTFILGGWGEGIFRFAKEMEEISNQKHQKTQ